MRTKYLILAISLMIIMITVKSSITQVTNAYGNIVPTSDCLQSHQVGAVENGKQQAIKAIIVALMCPKGKYSSCNVLRKII